MTSSVHIEVCQRLTSAAEPRLVGDRVVALLRRAPHVASGPFDITSDVELVQHVERVRVCDLPDGAATVSSLLMTPVVHVYQLNSASPEIAGGGGDDTGITQFSAFALPCADFEGLWESLVMEDGIKDELLAYASSALAFSDAGASPLLVTWNHVILLHGPAGTGKTSLAKALGHKLAVRHGARFSSAQLVEINAHAMFSKWFSESGKLVSRLFARIGELADDDDTLVVMLIDEVESLTAARSSVLQGAEPSDALRVVNAVLTAVDALRAKPNVLLVATSNLAKAIDAAFVDRADVKVWVGPPPAPARYAILASAFEELARVGVIAPPVALLTFSDATSAAAVAAAGAAAAAGGAGGDQGDGGGAVAALLASALVAQAAGAADGMSGRSLRKLPLQAHARFVRRAHCAARPVTFARALVDAVAAEARARAHFVPSGGGGRRLADCE